MAKMGKRKYPSLYNKNTGIWYTGYAHDWGMEEKVLESDGHEVRELKLQYSGYGRGRSAANIYMTDDKGNSYAMSMSGFDLLMRITDSPYSQQREDGIYNKFDIQRATSLSGAGVWFTGSFCQTKQGQNYFIEPCEVR